MVVKGLPSRSKNAGPPRRKIQRCLVHAQRVVRRHTTARPRTDAGRAIYQLALNLTRITTLDQAATWGAQLHEFGNVYRDWMDQKTFTTDPLTKQRSWSWTHERTRKAYNSLNHLWRNQLLFVYLDPPDGVLDVERIKSTTNSLEGGINAQLKLLARTHRGRSGEHQRRMLEWWLYLKTDHARLSVFVGTTNHTEFIGDTTGDRRYRVIEITERILEGDLTREEMDLMLAEARDRYRSGERFRHDEEFEEKTARRRRNHRYTPTADSILEWLEKVDSERRDRNGSGRRVDADVDTTALIDEQVRFSEKGSPSRNDIISAMDGMRDYQCVDLGDRSRIRRVIDGDSKPHPADRSRPGAGKTFLEVSADSTTTRWHVHAAGARKDSVTRHLSAPADGAGTGQDPGTVRRAGSAKVPA